MEMYRIKREIEETECEQCGCPLGIGDTVFLDDPDAFCSRGCATKFREASTAHIAAQAHLRTSRYAGPRQF
jgi:hypothetical protein